MVVKWMTGLPAPDVVLDLLCCRCRQVCEAPTCECLANGLRCSVAATVIQKSVQTEMKRRKMRRRNVTKRKIRLMMKYKDDAMW